MDQSSCFAALGNTLSLVSADRSFPGNVFVGPWDEFLFFDSDWIKDSEFVRTVQTLLRVEGATCAGLLTLDSGTGLDNRVRRLFIYKETEPSAYQRLLAGEGPEDGWVYDISGYCCASDKAAWCLYCEEASEIGVVPFREPESFAVYASAIAKLHAVRLEEAIAGPLSYGFSERGSRDCEGVELLRNVGLHAVLPIPLSEVIIETDGTDFPPFFLGRPMLELIQSMGAEVDVDIMNSLPPAEEPYHT